MILKEIVDGITINQGFWLVVVLTLVQITPIKINPWTFIFRWIGKTVNGELYEKIEALQTELKDVKRDFEFKNANDWRWEILDFFNSSRNNRPHSKEEWEHAIDQVKKYEKYVEKHDIDNGILEEASIWLRKEYQEHLNKNDFLKVEEG